MAEVRAIDANALMDTIRQHEYQLAAQRGTIDYGMFTIGIQQAVDEQPTIDPDDLRPRGRWITHDNGITECSECHTLGSPQWKCCPVCTAMMDGKENEDA